MKRLLVVSLIVSVIYILNGCTKPNYSSIETTELPEELKGCKFFKVDPGGNTPSMTVGRCPNSSTTVSVTENSGKTSVAKTSITIDGQEYTKKD